MQPAMALRSAIPRGLATILRPTALCAFASVPEEAVLNSRGPRMPAFDYSPPEYTGPSKQEVLHMRKHHLSPGEMHTMPAPALPSQQSPFHMRLRAPAAPASNRQSEPGRARQANRLYMQHRLICLLPDPLSLARTSAALSNMGHLDSCPPAQHVASMHTLHA